jgi:hypothetical protein
MYLCMQGDQSDPRIVLLAPADIARLPHLIITKIVFSNKQPSTSAGTTPTYIL